MAAEVDRCGHIRQVRGQAVRRGEEHRARVLHRRGPLLPHGQQELQVSNLNILQALVRINESIIVKIILRVSGLFSSLCAKCDD